MRALRGLPLRCGVRRKLSPEGSPGVAASLSRSVRPRDGVGDPYRPPLDPDRDGFGWCEPAHTAFYSTTPKDRQDTTTMAKPALGIHLTGLN